MIRSIRLRSQCSHAFVKVVPNDKLSRMQLEREPVVHQRFEFLVVLVRILLAFLSLDFSDSVFVNEVALDREVTSIDDEMNSSLASHTERA